MTDKNSYWESFKADGAAIADKVRDIVHEGNVRRVVVKHEGRTVAEFPLTAGVVGAQKYGVRARRSARPEIAMKSEHVRTVRRCGERGVRMQEVE